MGDRRGFEYQLEPVQRKTDWDLNDVAQELARINREVQEQERKLQRLTEEFSAVQASWAKQLRSERLNVDMQRFTYAYLGTLQDKICLNRDGLRTLEQNRDAALARSHNLRKFADNIGRHRDEAVREHERRMADLAYKDADDIWLQRMTWKEKV
jgi:hypothetical protein